MRVLRMDRLEQQVGELIQANTELHARLDSIQKGKDDGGPETARGDGDHEIPQSNGRGLIVDLLRPCTLFRVRTHKVVGLSKSF
jgi:hypothetical protein